LREFENRVLKRIFGPKRDEVTGICALHQLWCRWSNWEERNGWGVEHIWGRGEVHTGSWWGYLIERDHLKDPGLDGRIILKWIFKKWGWGHGLGWSGSG
jgi:hypothetical protein